MRKYILILIAVILLGVLMMYTLKSQSKKKNMHSEITVADTTGQQVSEKQPLTSKVLHQESTKEKPMKTTEFSEATPLENPSFSTKVLYKTLPLEEAQLITKQKRDITPVAAITLNADTFDTMKKGETLILPDIGGLDYTLTIVDVQTYENGATSTTAKYEDEGVTYTTTITRSPTETFITLATAQGMYEIETEAGTGYIYDSSDIRKQMQRPNKNDVIILPIPQK